GAVGKTVGKIWNLLRRKRCNDRSPTWNIAEELGRAWDIDRVALIFSRHIGPGEMKSCDCPYLMTTGTRHTIRAEQEPPNRLERLRSLPTSLITRKSVNHFVFTQNLRNRFILRPTLTSRRYRYRLRRQICIWYLNYAPIEFGYRGPIEQPILELRQ